MFTFLDFNDVPWNNNNAEHEVKAFATVRRIIEGPMTEKGLREFLVLLSICETCKCKNVDFLDFSIGHERHRRIREPSKETAPLAIKSGSLNPDLKRDVSLARAVPFD